LPEADPSADTDSGTCRPTLVRRRITQCLEALQLSIMHTGLSRSDRFGGDIRNAVDACHRCIIKIATFDAEIGDAKTKFVEYRAQLLAHALGDLFPVGVDFRVAEAALGKIVAKGVDDALREDLPQILDTKLHSAPHHVDKETSGIGKLVTVVAVGLEPHRKIVLGILIPDG